MQTCTLGSVSTGRPTAVDPQQIPNASSALLSRPSGSKGSTRAPGYRHWQNESFRLAQDGRKPPEERSRHRLRQRNITFQIWPKLWGPVPGAQYLRSIAGNKWVDFWFMSRTDLLASAPRRMRKELEKTSVVLSGAWNHAIFSPKWVAEKVLSQPSAPLNAVVSFLATGGTMVEISPLGKVAIRLLPGRLEVIPLEPSPEALAEMEQTAIAIARALPETPLFAIGINFGYAVADGKHTSLLECKDQSIFEDAGFATSNVQVWRDFRKGDLILRYLTHWDPAKGLSLEFNRHFDLVGNAGRAEKVLQGAVAETLELVTSFEEKVGALC